MKTIRLFIVLTFLSVNLFAQVANPVPQKIAAGGSHSLYVCEDGSVKAGGKNSNGQLGIGNNTNMVLTAVTVNGLTNVIAVAGRNESSIFLKNDGTVWGSGANNSGELGIGGTTPSNVPVQIPNFNNVVKIAFGMFHTLFLKSDGTVWSCGNNFSGQLGIGNTNNQSTPQLITSLSNVVDIAAGDGHSVFLMADGTVKTCGDNQDGALGLGNGIGAITPTLVNIQNVAAVGAGFRRSIFVKQDGTVWIVGNNTYGSLGIGGTDAQWLPIQIPNLTGIIAAAGAQYHNLFLKNDGTVWASGYNAYGQLGDGTNINRAGVVKVVGINNANEIAASGYYFSLLATTDNKFYAFGQNGGAFGNGNGENSNIPVLIMENCIIASLASEEINISKMSVFPNPTTGKVFFSKPLKDISVYTISGQKIPFQLTNKNELNISHLNNGLYIIKAIDSKSNQNIFKILKK